MSSDGVTRLTYDRGGRLIAIADPAGATTALAYDSSGFLSLVAPAIGQGVVVDFEEGAPGQPMIVGAVYTDTAGRWFSINLRGRVSACTTCP